MRKLANLILLLITITTMNCVVQGQGKKSVKIIFDTDMGPDYDDVGAIAILHTLASKGECEILATIASDSHLSIAPTVDLFNRFFKKSDIPVGRATVNAPAIVPPNHWNDSLINRFDSKLQNKEYPSSLAVYRKTLAEQEDHSVTIVTVGFVSNLYELLQSKADQFSPLSGKELIKQKVEKLVAMAGAFPSGAEFNVKEDTISSFGVFNEWPTPILFSGFEIGKEIHTGGSLAKKDPQHNPLAWAYQYNLATYTEKGEEQRPSWDQTAVLCAVRNPEDYFYINGPGKLIVHQDGTNTWDPNMKAKHYFLSHKYPYAEIAKEIEDLMMNEK